MSAALKVEQIAEFELLDGAEHAVSNAEEDARRTWRIAAGLADVATGDLVKGLREVEQESSDVNHLASVTQLHPDIDGQTEFRIRAGLIDPATGEHVKSASLVTGRSGSVAI